MRGTEAKFRYVLRLADDHLILAHRISEWCGHAPMLEEDLALPNIALDMLGQARALYDYAGILEGKGRSEDDLAFLRREEDYTNLLICELANGDFAHTLLRIFYFSTYMEEVWSALLSSNDKTLAGIAGKAVKEARYHVRHSAQWVIRLGDGTDESAERLSNAYLDLQAFCGEFFVADQVTQLAAEDGYGIDPSTLENSWKTNVEQVFAEAMLEKPAPVSGHQTGGRFGEHLEDMGHLLAELQYMQRTYPGMKW